MILNQETLRGVATGDITAAFRRWRRPTVKAGGTLRTVIGVLAIDTVTETTESEITGQDARRAGHQSRTALLTTLAAPADGRVLYRIEFRLAGTDPRVDLRTRVDLTEDERREVLARLERFDQRSRAGAWTLPTLRLIGRQPGVRAADLASALDRETAPFKTDVRKLKELGLTESLEVGYRLSPRGQEILATLERT